MSIRTYASVLLASFCILVASAQAPAWQPAPGHTQIPIWPNGVPGGTHPNAAAEIDTTTAKDNLIAGKPLIRLGNVSSPTITFYAPKNAKSDTPAIVVFPGGGYHILAYDLEGTEVCDWLNSIGVTGVLLKYRVPIRAGQKGYEAPLQDAQRAISLVRYQDRKSTRLNSSHSTSSRMPSSA